MKNAEIFENSGKEKPCPREVSPKRQGNSGAMMV
jgi:hypothetical protein